MLSRPSRILRGLALSSLVLAGPVTQLFAQPANELARGKRLFAMHCSICHGPNGEGGKGPMLAQPTLPRASDMDSLRRIIRSGISGTEMPSFRFDPDQLKDLADFVKSLGSLPTEIVPGDAARGRELFTSKGSCLTCHALHGQGGSIGPDLTEIGRKRSAAYLRRALLDPAAEVPQSFTAFRADVSLPENFLFVRVSTRDGRSAAGVRVNEDTFSIQIRELDGKVRSFFKSELTELN